MTNDGVYPIVDDDVRYHVLFPGRSHAVIEVFDGDASSIGRPIPDDLVRLIESAKRYPPAVALARRDVDDRRGETTSSEALYTMIRQTLDDRLRGQRSDRATLVRSRLADEDLRHADEWVWIIDRVPDSADVIWVGRDFECYASPASEFDLA